MGKPMISPKNALTQRRSPKTPMWHNGVTKKATCTSGLQACNQSDPHHHTPLMPEGLHLCLSVARLSRLLLDFPMTLCVLGTLVNITRLWIEHGAQASLLGGHPICWGRYNSRCRAQTRPRGWLSEHGWGEAGTESKQSQNARARTCISVFGA